MDGSVINAGGCKPTQRLVVLGASGSVGSTTIEYLRTAGGSEITLSGISVHGSVQKLRDLIREFSPPIAAISDPDVYGATHEELQREFPHVRFYGGAKGLSEMLQDACETEGADTVLTAVVGSAGIQATLVAIQMGMKIALANKETLVTAGPPILAALQQSKANGKNPVILPVDSEHNAIFQLLDGQPAGHFRKIVLTASGGPFFEIPLDQLPSVTREQVLSHPTWSMGPKITVDSAGMINKGLEIIEAHYLFSAPYEDLDVLIHRKSLVHGMIETTDGGFHMCASSPSMVFPVAHVLHYPEPVPHIHSVARRPHLWDGIQFHPVELERYPGFRLALEAGRAGGTATASFNGANEQAVEMFLNGVIGFTDIPTLIGLVLDQEEVGQGNDLDIYLEADSRARRKILELVQSGFTSRSGK